MPLWALAVQAVLVAAGHPGQLRRPRADLRRRDLPGVRGLVSLAAWRAQARDLRERGDAPFVLPGGPVLPLVSVAAMLAIVTTLNLQERLAIAIALAALVGVYGVLRILRRRAGA